MHGHIDVPVHPSHQDSVGKLCRAGFPIAVASGMGRLTFTFTFCVPRPWRCRALIYVLCHTAKLTSACMMHHASCIILALDAVLALALTASS